MMTAMFKKTILLVAASLMIPVSAWATFTYTAIPSDNNSALRFGTVSTDIGEVNREVVVNINSDIAKQYRFSQALYEPISSADGSVFPPMNLRVVPLRKSIYGTFNLNESTGTPVTSNKQYIYTSTTAGQSDNFTLSYRLALSGNIAPGSYRGRISFILEPVDSSLPPVIQNLFVYIDVTTRSKVELSTATGSKLIRIDAERPDPQTSSVAINIKGGLGRMFKVLQAPADQFVSSDGSRLDWNAVTVTCKEAKSGMPNVQQSGWTNQPQVVYTSSPRGEEDSFVLEYGLGDLSAVQAGTYRTLVKYFVDTLDGKVTLIDSLNFEISSPRIFDLAIVPQEASGRIEFRSLKADEPPKTSEVLMEVRSNIGKRYQLIQHIDSAFTDKQGRSIPPTYFTVQTETVDSLRGTLKFTEQAEAKIGDSALYISDSKGNSAKFKVTYKLGIPRDLIAGDYGARITYSLVEL